VKAKLKPFRDLGDVWEEELFASAKVSARRAWSLTACALALAALGLGHSLYALSTHKIEPVVITVDNQTGLSQVRSRIGDVTLDDDEAITQSYLYRYVRDRETYDLADNSKRIEGVYAESTGQAAESLFAIWGEDNGEHPSNIYGDRGKITVRIRSISFIDADTASLRIRKHIRDGGAVAERDYVVTLDFMYARGGERLLEALWQNPLGFSVTSYRIDADSFQGENDA